jgi:monoamine oxidase
MVTRREFLNAIAAAAAPLPQLERFIRSGAAQRVIVIGGGLAGLCTAYELQALGYTVTVLEAQMRPGGRVRTLREPFAPGVQVEAGAEQIPGAHEVTQHYARVLGLTLVPNRTVGTRLLYYVRGHRVVNGDAAVWPFALTDEERTLGLSGLFRKYVDEDIAYARAVFPENTVRALAELDRQTIGAWLRSRGASAAAVELITLGFGAGFVSAAAFVLHSVNSRGSIQNYRIDGGNDRLPREFATRVDVKYGVPVVGVRQDDSRRRDLRAGRPRQRRVARRSRRLHAAVPRDRTHLRRRAAVRRQAARDSRTALLSHRESLSADTDAVLVERQLERVCRNRPANRTLTPDPGVDPGSRGALAAYPIGAYTSALEKMSEDERVAAARDQATQMFPELGTEGEGGISHCWGLDPWERGSFALHTPGQIGFLDTLAAVEGRIHFAGEHTSRWTGWMQGALESARRVVREING